MNFDINDFLEYANTGTAPTVYSRQQAARKPATVSPRTAVTTAIMTAPVIPSPATTLIQTQKPALELVMYSERSFAVFGDTKPVKTQLEGLFGKFNRYLKKDGIATPGYIFSIGRLDSVKKALSI